MPSMYGKKVRPAVQKKIDKQGSSKIGKELASDKKPSTKKGK